MIPTKSRESRRMKTVKLPKNLERAYRENDCQECTVVVTRMDFAKILGKFTKVKIQYESSATSKPKRSYSRLKSNENGLVQSNSVQKLQGTKKSKNEPSSSPILNNILRENNKIRKTYSRKTNNDYNDTRNDYKLNSPKIKHYGIVFENPIVKKNDFISTTSLEDLIPSINDSILPSESWSIDYFPKNGEPKDDKVYDRIAAELEDLMCAEKNPNVAVKDDKVDDFPSIMDILNDNPKEVSDKTDQNNTVNLESNDVEAMLLGKGDQSKSTPMDIDNDNTDVNSFLTDVTQINTEPSILNQGETNKTTNPAIMDESPDSPSILEENQKEVTPQIPSNQDEPKETTEDKQTSDMTSSKVATEMDENDNTNADNKNKEKVLRTGVTQVIFKKNVNDICQKSVICPKNLKYNISMLGKSIELLGAPKVISSLEDLQVLLQIVDESNLDSVYILH